VVVVDVGAGGGAGGGGGLGVKDGELKGVSFVLFLPWFCFGLSGDGEWLVGWLAGWLGANVGGGIGFSGVADGVYSVGL